MVSSREGATLLWSRAPPGAVSGSRAGVPSGDRSGLQLAGVAAAPLASAAASCDWAAASAEGLRCFRRGSGLRMRGLRSGASRRRSGSCTSVMPASRCSITGWVETEEITEAADDVACVSYRCTPHCPSEKQAFHGQRAHRARGWLGRPTVWCAAAEAQRLPRTHHWVPLSCRCHAHLAAHRRLYLHGRQLQTPLAEPAYERPPQTLHWQFHCWPSALSMACGAAQALLGCGCRCGPGHRLTVSCSLLPARRCQRPWSDSGCGCRCGRAALCRRHSRIAGGQAERCDSSAACRCAAGTLPPGAPHRRPRDCWPLQTAPACSITVKVLHKRHII